MTSGCFSGRVPFIVRMVVPREKSRDLLPSQQVTQGRRLGLGLIRLVSLPHLHRQSMNQYLPHKPSHASNRVGFGELRARGQHSEEEYEEDRGWGQEGFQYFASCTRGLEKILAQELLAPEIGAYNVYPGHAGVRFQGSLETGYRANLWLRSAVRVMMELAVEDLDPREPGGDAVYEFVRRLGDREWGELVPVGGTFAITSHVWDCSQIRNSALASTRVKDAVCDALRQVGRPKPMKPEFTEDVDLPLQLSLYRDRAILYRDMSGSSLHKRGYRDAMHRASLNEAVAAGCLQLAGWPDMVRKKLKAGEDVMLMDPMCGSGTFLIEGALMAMNVAPGLMRRVWPFHTWHDFNPELWSRCCEDARSRVRADLHNLRLVGNDTHEGALALVHKDAHAAGVEHLLELYHLDIKDFVPPTRPNMILTNPPWGLRIGGEASEEDGEWVDDMPSGPISDDIPPPTPQMEAAWSDLGNFLRRECASTEVNILCGNPEATRPLGMRAHGRSPVMVGGVDCRLLQYDVLPPRSKEGAHRAAPACHKCGQVGHIARECPNRDVCRVCGQAGHFARDCPESKIRGR